MDNHPYYNRTNFPIVVIADHCGGNFDVCSNEARTHCASIAKVPGCKSTHHGEWRHALETARYCGSMRGTD